MEYVYQNADPASASRSRLCLSFHKVRVARRAPSVPKLCGLLRGERLGHPWPRLCPYCPRTVSLVRPICQIFFHNPNPPKIHQWPSGERGGSRATSPKSALSDTPLVVLLRQACNLERKTSTADGRPPHRRSSAPSRIPRVTLQRGDAEAAESQDYGSERHLRHLQREIH